MHRSGSIAKGRKKYSVFIYTPIDGLFQSKTLISWWGRKFWDGISLYSEDKMPGHSGSK
jgi:hypothetical protein